MDLPGRYPPIDILSFLVEEVVKIRAELSRLESRICDIEDSSLFNPADPRYQRLCSEKKSLSNSLSELRINLASSFASQPQPRSPPRIIQNGNLSNLPAPPLGAPSGVSYPPTSSVFSTGADADGGTPSVPKRPRIEGEASESVSQAPHNLFDAMEVPHGDNNNTEEDGEIIDMDSVSGGSTSKARKLPEPQQAEYLERKGEVAKIMRNFSEKRIVLVGKDNNEVTLPTYQALKARVKQGEDIANLLKGTLEKFVTQIDKKRGVVTEKQIFVPAYRFI
eukprot:gene131-141_t